MSEREELARSLLAAFNQLDADAACAVTDPQVKFVAIAEQVTGPLPTGHDGLREWFRAASRTWEELSATASEWAIEERGDWFVISGTTRGVARETERELQWGWTAVGRAEGGLIVEFGIYLDREEALRSIEAAEASSTSGASKAAGP